MGFNPLPACKPEESIHLRAENAGMIVSIRFRLASRKNPFRYNLKLHNNLTLHVREGCCCDTGGTAKFDGKCINTSLFSKLLRVARKPRLRPTHLRFAVKLPVVRPGLRGGPHRDAQSGLCLLGLESRTASYLPCRCTR